MSFAPNHGHYHSFDRSNNAGLTAHGKVRTDFSGLFPAPPGSRVRTRNNSQTQKPVTLLLGGPGHSDPWPSTELQFHVEEDQRDNLSCEQRDKTSGWSHQVSLDMNGITNTATRPSFDILNDDSAEAYEFFAAAASSGIEFGRDDCGLGSASKRQRHFSLEDYNDLADQFSSNESSNESFLGRQHLSTKFGGLNSMQVDEYLSVNGSETPSTPSTPSMAGLSNAFTFPVNNSESLFNPIRGLSDTVSLDTDPHHISAQLQSELRQRLLAAIEEKSSKSLQFPSNLLQEISAHVIQEASLEPCGLKGCLIFIHFEDENDCQYLSTLRCDPATIPTFELTLTLGQNQSKNRGWIPNIVKRNFAVMPNIMVSTSYRLVKRRKYRLNEIEELSLQSERNG